VGSTFVDRLIAFPDSRLAVDAAEAENGGMLMIDNNPGCTIWI